MLANDHGDEPTIVANTEPTPRQPRTRRRRRLHLHAGSRLLRHRQLRIHDRRRGPPLQDRPAVDRQLRRRAAARRLLRLLALPGPRPPERILRPRGPRPERRIAEDHLDADDRHPAEALLRPRRSPASSSNEGEAELVEEIPLRDSTGHPFSGLVNSQAPTGETIETLKGVDARPRPRRLRPRGPRRDARRQLLGLRRVRPVHHPLHLARAAKSAVSRRSTATLPAELKKRVPNRGMEGLTITPDGHTLVGMMQSSLQQAGPAGRRQRQKRHPDPDRHLQPLHPPGARVPVPARRTGHPEDRQQ